MKNQSFQISLFKSINQRQCVKNWLANCHLRACMGILCFVWSLVIPASSLHDHHEGNHHWILCHFYQWTWSHYWQDTYWPHLPCWLLELQKCICPPTPDDEKYIINQNIYLGKPSKKIKSINKEKFLIGLDPLPPPPNLEKKLGNFFSLLDPLPPP